MIRVGFVLVSGLLLVGATSGCGSSKSKAEAHRGALAADGDSSANSKKDASAKLLGKWKAIKVTADGKDITAELKKGGGPAPVMEFTKDSFTSNMGGDSKTESYKVVKQDANSVTIQGKKAEDAETFRFDGKGHLLVGGSDFLMTLERVAG